MRIINKIKSKIESKRDRKKIFWKPIILSKDILWEIYALTLLGILEHRLRTSKNKIKSIHNRIKFVIESKRDSKKPFWKYTILIKDSLWRSSIWLRRLMNNEEELDNLKKIKKILKPLKGVGNDYTFIEREIRKTKIKKYYKKASVIIPVYNRKKALEKTLASLLHQTYPRKLFEIIVTDDGSTEDISHIIKEYKKFLKIRYIRQEKEGFRAGKARNNAVNISKNPYIIFLDCDMIPSTNLIEAYMKWFHITDKVALIGNRKFVNSDSITAKQIKRNFNAVKKLKGIIPNNDIMLDNPAKIIKNGELLDWRIRRYKETNNLKEARYPFTLFFTGNVAVSKKNIIEAGKFDEEFNKWSGEDVELGYRLYQKGLYFIPLQNCMGYHQEHPPADTVVSRKKNQEENNLILNEKIPCNRIYKNKKELFNVPKVSIYIPSYNCGEYIKRAVDSALNQTFKDIEICICDDSSTDNTIEILNKYYKNNPKVRWVKMKHGGIGKASNTAVKMCKGEYIGQLDADDILLPNAVEECIRIFEARTNIGVVYSTNEIINKKGKIIGPNYNFPIYSREKLFQAMIVHHFRMFRKRDFSRTNGFNEHMHNAIDYDIFCQLSNICNFRHLNKRLYLYRLHGRNTSIVDRKKQIENEKRVKRRLLKFHDSKGKYKIIFPRGKIPSELDIIKTK